MMSCGSVPDPAITLSEQPRGCGAIIPRAHEEHTECDDDTGLLHKKVFMSASHCRNVLTSNRLGGECEQCEVKREDIFTSP